MPYPRSALISLDATPWYHVISRCVRRAFLCGEDAVTGRNFEHRRGWIVERLEQLAGVFAIDVAAYAVMSNHFHLVVRVDAERARDWSEEEVLRRWTRLYVGPELVQRYVRDGEAGLGAAELEAVRGWAETYRARLGDLSWYMRLLNQSLARMANAEDKVTGRFWGGGSGATPCWMKPPCSRRWRMSISTRFERGWPPFLKIPRLPRLPSACGRRVRRLTGAR